ncbi:AsnC family transcriptional regulator [Tepidamorphus gemmatus]|jgi:Lrp/AsnC family transcriptional regulator|uniref:AsnC family transcriptional regulator n=1 Tax=Tepidamorphus gemmatus TaxID=747076 RepID=A0A4R3M1G1_9HYPH|nr:Lrp/AsnC family transcriptional regulator [Tepidamorphus gemmatus]TCT06496.1 AsnC family transcriptional regulator [Tepidamorphus gemmatus]
MARSARISLDAGDIRILRELQRDASRPVAEIAKAVGMSQTPCWRRIKRLKDAGVIRQTVALLDRRLLGLDFVAYAFVKLALPSRANMEAFDRLVATWPEVLFCERVTGAVDYLIKVVVEDMSAYDEFLRYRLLDQEMVSDVQSRIVIATSKDTTELPVWDD